MFAPEPLRTELPPKVRERTNAMKHSPRPRQLPITEARRMKRESLAEQTTESQQVDEVKEFRIPGPEEAVPIRSYIPDGDGPFPVLALFHGGGFVRGGLKGTDTLARYLTDRLEATIVVVDYRLAPEDTFPAALLDCYAAVSWLADNSAVVHGDPDRLAVGGMSAGGNLAAATALLARDRGGPALVRQVLGMPMLDTAADTHAHKENGEDYGLTTAGLNYYWDAYLQSDIDRVNAYACPLQARDLTELPPATVITVGFDPLRDLGIAYANRLKEASVTVELLHFPDMPHHLMTFLEGEVDAAAAAWKEITVNLRANLHDQ